MCPCPVLRRRRLLETPAGQSCQAAGSMDRGASPNRLTGLERSGGSCAWTSTERFALCFFSGSDAGTRRVFPSLSRGTGPGQRGEERWYDECGFCTALFAYLLGKLTCPVALTLYEHGRTMVEQPIERCRRCRRVTKDRPPFSGHPVTGHNDALLFVTC